MKTKSLGMTTLLAALAVLAMGCGGNGGHGTHSDDGSAAPAMAKADKILQKTCPVMGGKIDPKVYAEHEGRKIYFCCKGCEKKFATDPEKYIEKVDDEIKKISS